MAEGMRSGRRQNTMNSNRNDIVASVAFQVSGRWLNDDSEVDVFCRNMGLPAPGYLLPAGMFGDTSGPTWIGDVSCKGSERRVLDCGYVVWGPGSFPDGWAEPPPRSDPAAAIACGGPPGAL